MRVVNFIGLDVGAGDAVEYAGSQASRDLKYLFFWIRTIQLRSLLHRIIVTSQTEACV